MGAPVWVLSVDLQTKTATFQSGMADAAKSARGAFTDIKTGSGEMGRETGVNMMEARHGVMMLGEEFGIRLPRALAGFIASIGPIGAAMEAAFPFLAIALGAMIFIEHLHKVHEAAEKLTEDQEKFGTAVQTSFNSLDEKLMQAQIKMDDLRGNHLAALAVQLKLIDMQSMAELVHQFDTVAKAADVVFTDLKGHWYDLGNDSVGAKHALDEFQAKYAALLAEGKRTEATDLLKGTRQSAVTVLDTLQRAVDAGVGNTKDKLAAQHELVDALNAQLTIEQKVAAVEGADKGAAKAGADKAGGRDAAKAAEKAKQIAEFAQKGVSEEARIIREANAKMATDIAQGEREKIDATKEGSAGRLAAIDSAIKAEEAAGMEGLGDYRGLLTARVNLARQMAEEEQKLRADAGREAASQSEKMGQLAIAAEREGFALSNSTHRGNAAERLAQEVQLANEETALQMTAVSQQIAALDKGGKEYENKLKDLQDRQIQLVQEHENAVTAIKDKAEMDRNSRILSADQHFMDSISHGLTQSIMGHQSWAKTLNSIGNEAVTGMLQNAIKSALMDDFTKEKDAAAAARKAFNIGLSVGGPAGMILGPVFGAAAFASVMAFEGGGIVPGVGRGDIVPAMLEPGEGVLPKQLMDRLNTGSSNTGPSSHFHVTAHYAPHISAVDSTGVDSLLSEHGDKFQAHFENTLRRMNK